MEKELLGSLELNRVYQMDCIEGMRLLPTSSVDLICIDPPYNIGKDKRWDKYKKDDYIAFMAEVFKECERVLKDNGSFYWFHNDMKQTRKLMDALDEETAFIQKNFIVWNKRYEGSPRKYYFDNVIKTESSRKFRPLTEYCLFYTFQKEKDVKHAKEIQAYFKRLQEKSGVFWYSSEIIISLINNGISKNEKSAKVIAKHKLDWNYNQFEFLTKKQYEIWKPLLRIDKSYEELKNIFVNSSYTFNHKGTHHDVWNYEVAPKQGHVTPKPLPLIENIIRHSSNKGDVILDCFGGSGTTFVAAERLDRRWVGFEREPEYIEISNQRLENIEDKDAEEELNR